MVGSACQQLRRRIMDMHGYATCSRAPAICHSSLSKLDPETRLSLPECTCLSMTSLELSIDLCLSFRVCQYPLVRWCNGSDRLLGFELLGQLDTVNSFIPEGLPIKCALDGRCFKRKPQSATPEHYSCISLVCTSSSVLGGGKSDVARLKAEIRSTCESLLTAGTRPGQ